MSARAPPAPSRPDCERSRWRPARPRHRSLAAAWSCGCCLGLGVGTAGSGIFGEVDFSDLHIPLLRMTRIEVLLKFLSIDLLLGHCLVDRAERLVLGGPRGASPPFLARCSQRGSFQGAPARLHHLQARWSVAAGLVDDTLPGSIRSGA